MDSRKPGRLKRRIRIDPDFDEPLPILGEDLLAAYRDLAGEEEREIEALVWAEATVGDVVNETALGTS